MAKKIDDIGLQQIPFVVYQNRDIGEIFPSVICLITWDMVAVKGCLGLVQSACNFFRADYMKFYQTVKMLLDSREELIRITPYVPNYDIFSFLKLNKQISSAISIILCLGTLLHLKLILIVAKKNFQTEIASLSLPAYPKLRPPILKFSSHTILVVFPSTRPKLH